MVSASSAKLDSLPSSSPPQVKAQAIYVTGGADGYTLQIAAYINDVWTSPEQIYTSQNPLTTPTLGQLDPQSAQADIVIWSEQRKTKTVLQSMTRSPDGAWGAAELLYDGSIYNLSPNLVKSADGSLWLFWASSGPGDADILAMQRTQQGWQPVIRVHEHNEVPDLSPSAALARDGSINVRWQQYDLKAMRYLEVSARIPTKVERLMAKSLAEHEDLILLREVPLPPELPSDRASTLFSAQNLLEQSMITY